VNDTAADRATARFSSKDCDLCGRHVRCRSTNDQSIAQRPKRQSGLSLCVCDISRRCERAATQSAVSDGKFGRRLHRRNVALICCVPRFSPGLIFCRRYYPHFVMPPRPIGGALSVVLCLFCLSVVYKKLPFLP